MEKGLDRALKFLKDSGISVRVLVTDRHTQINKWLKESHEEMNILTCGMWLRVSWIGTKVSSTFKLNWQRLKIAVLFESGLGVLY